MQGGQRAREEAYFLYVDERGPLSNAADGPLYEVGLAYAHKLLNRRDPSLHKQRDVVERRRNEETDTVG